MKKYLTNFSIITYTYGDIPTPAGGFEYGEIKHIELYYKSMQEFNANAASVLYMSHSAPLTTRTQALKSKICSLPYINMSELFPIATNREIFSLIHHLTEEELHRQPRNLTEMLLREL